jgi:hypothetical protein
VALARNPRGQDAIKGGNAIRGDEEEVLARIVTLRAPCRCERGAGRATDSVVSMGGGVIVVLRLAGASMVIGASPPGGARRTAWPRRGRRPYCLRARPGSSPGGHQGRAAGTKRCRNIAPAMAHRPCRPRCFSCRRRRCSAWCHSRGASGIGHSFSPESVHPRTRSWSTRLGRSPKQRAVGTWPRATVAAPVRVARSTTQRGRRLTGHIQRVGQHQTSLGVRVEHFHRFPGAGVDHVARAHGIDPPACFPPRPTGPPPAASGLNRCTASTAPSTAMPPHLS